MPPTERRSAAPRSVPRAILPRPLQLFPGHSVLPPFLSRWLFTPTVSWWEIRRWRIAYEREGEGEEGGDREMKGKFGKTTADDERARQAELLLKL